MSWFWLALLGTPGTISAPVVESWHTTAPVRLSLGQTDLTPPEPLPLGGYTERRGALAQSGGDRLLARTLLLSSGEHRVAWVTMEALTVPEGFAAAVQSRLPAGVNLVLNATHTHGAPDSQMLNPRMTLAIPGIASYRPRWLAWYADRIAQSIRNQLNLQGTPVSQLSARTQDVPLNRARRAGATPPRTATQVTATLPGLGELDALHHYTAHPTLFDESDLQTRGDWPGVVLRGSPGLLLNGPLGDVSPGSPELDALPTPVARAGALGQAVLAVRTVRPCTVFTSGDPVQWSRATAPTPIPTPHPEFARRNGIPDALAQSLVARFAPTTRTVSVLTLGRLAVIGISAEPTSAVGRRVQRVGEQAGFEPVLVVSHTQGWAGYVLERDDYRRGGYEATLSFFGDGDADAWVTLTRAAFAPLQRPTRRPSRARGVQ